MDIALQTEPVREDQEVQAILVDNLEQNEENVDIISPAPVRSAPLSLHVDENSVTRSSQVRTHDIAGISSIRPVDRSIGSGIRQMQPRTSTINRRHSSDFHDSDEYHRRRGRPPERGGPPDRGRPPDRGGLPSGRGPPNERGGPPDRGRPPDDGGPLDDDGGPPSNRGSSDGNGGPPMYPYRRGAPGPRGPPRPVRPVLIQQPQVVLDTSALENTFDMLPG